MSDAEVRKHVDRKQWGVLLNHDQVYDTSNVATLGLATSIIVGA